MVDTARMRRENEIYRVYVTDCLKAIGKQTGVEFKCRYYEMVHPEPDDTEGRSGMEIAKARLAAFGIEVIDNGN